MINICKTHIEDIMATSTKAELLKKIDQFLETNKHVTDAGFGKLAVNDTNLVKRLRSGGDITTTKLDAILRFLINPNQKVKTDGNSKD